MLLIFLSSRAFSLLRGSLGSFRILSDWSSPGRGWRWPIGASRWGWPWFFAAVEDPPLLLLCAIAAGPPIKTSNAANVITVRILFLHSIRENASIAPGRVP